MKRNLVHAGVGIWFLMVLVHAASADWTKLPVNSAVYSMIVVGNRILAGTAGGGVFWSTDTGTTWTAATTQPPNYSGSIVYCFTQNGSSVFLGTNNGASRSDDSGRTWVAAMGGTGPHQMPQPQVRAMASRGGKIFAANYFNICISSDNGDNWYPIYPTGGNQLAYLPLAFHGDTLFTSANEGGIIRMSDISGTGNWSNIHVDVFSAMHGFEIRCYAMDGNTIFAGTTHNVYKSTDGGFTDAGWTESDSGVNLSVIESVAKSGQYVFAGSSYGVYVSTNNGNNWSGLNTGTISNAVHSLLIVGDKVLAGNDGGAWRMSYPGLVGTTVTAPRQGTTKQHSEAVTTRMYDLSGRQTAVRVTESRASGARSAFSNTCNAAAGCYAARMLVGENTVKQSIVIPR
jgi:hypothetical protein